MSVNIYDKLLAGSGLKTYSQLLSEKLNNDIRKVEDDLSSAIDRVIGDASSEGNTLGKLEDRIEANSSSISDNRDSIESLIVVTNGLTETVNNLTTNVIPNIENDISRIDESIATLSGNTDESIASLSSAIDEINNDISGINNDISGINADISNINSNIVGLSTTVGEIQENIAGMSTTIESIQDDIASVTTTISSMQEDIVGITSTIADLGNSYKELQEVKEFVAPEGCYFIGIGQNTQGVVTAVTAPLPTASTITAGQVIMSEGSTTSVVYDVTQTNEAISLAIAESQAAIISNIIVSDLPQEGQDNLIYLVPNSSETTPNYYLEYMWVNVGTAETPSYQWEIIGNTELTVEVLSSSQDGEVDAIFTEVFGGFM